MVATNDNTQTKTGIGFSYGEIYSLPLGEILKEFDLCPSSLYMRGNAESPLVDSEFDKVTNDLTIPVGEDDTVIQVLSPLKYFKLSQEQIDKWDIKDAEVGINYLLNGNTRYKTLIRLIKEQPDLTYADIPLQEIVLEDNCELEVLFNLQSLYNNTTTPHTTLQTTLSLGRLYLRMLEKTPQTQVIKKLTKLNRVTGQTLSTSKKMVEEEIKNPKEFEYLVKLIESGFMAVDTAITIIQFREANAGTAQSIVNDACAFLGINPSDEKATLSKVSFKQWVNHVKELFDSGLPVPSNTPEEIKESEEKARDIISTGLGLIANDIPEINSQASIDDSFKYVEGMVKLSSVIKQIADYIPVDQRLVMFKQTLENVASLVQNPTILEALEPSQVIAIGKKIESVSNILCKKSAVEEVIISSDEPQKETTNGKKFKKTTKTTSKQTEIAF